MIAVYPSGSKRDCHVASLLAMTILMHDTQVNVVRERGNVKDKCRVSFFAWLKKKPDLQVYCRNPQGDFDLQDGEMGQMRTSAAHGRPSGKDS
jgi:hypothetical protein